MRRRVLSISYDKALLDTRAMILQQHGFSVQSVQNVRDAIQLCREETFHIAVIGHSIPATEQKEVAAAIRQNCPGVIVVALKRCDADEVSFADAALDTFKPDELVSKLRQILDESGAVA